MVIAIGMAMQWRSLKLNALPILVPVFIIQLLLMPVIGWTTAYWLNLQGQLLAALVLETAMPCMVIGMVLCERYKLDCLACFSGNFLHIVVHGYPAQVVLVAVVMTRTRL